MAKESRFERALNRNLSEVTHAILNMTVLHGIGNQSGFTFKNYCRMALEGDLIVRLIRILDTHRDSAGFFYLYRCRKKRVEEFAKQKGIDLRGIENVANRLTPVRNKSLAHIDREGVFNRAEIWKEAGFKWPEIDAILHNIRDILDSIHQQEFDCEWGIPELSNDFDVQG